jgi:DNA polymerase epsilon subunit 1
MYYSQIKMENMAEYCSCAGDFQTLVSRNDLAVYLKIFRGIAQHFKMPLLLETVEFNIQMNPGLIT